MMALGLSKTERLALAFCFHRMHTSGSEAPWFKKTP